MKQTTFSDLERNNKTCMYAHLIDSSIMTLFCILQALSGLQTWGYIIIFAFWVWTGYCRVFLLE